MDNDKIEKVLKITSKLNIIIPILTLIVVSILSYKALTYKSKIDTYEEYFTIIENKDKNTVDLNYESSFNIDEYKNSEINEYIKCLNTELTNEQLSEKIKLSIRTLENLFNQSNNYFFL